METTQKLPEAKETNKYALEVLKSASFTAETFTAEELKEVGIIVGQEVKANRGEKRSLYLSTRNAENKPTQAIYFSTKARTHVIEGQILTPKDVLFYYVSTDVDGKDLENPYFVAGAFGREFVAMV